jgi:hypothetical protein
MKAKSQFEMGRPVLERYQHFLLESNAQPAAQGPESVELEITGPASK